MKKTDYREFPKATDQAQSWPDVDPPNDRLTSSDSLPRISVITPSYNQADFLEATLRSVLLQNYPNLEYLVIDGGSDDGSVELIKQYEPWIDYWISEPDEGQTQAINKGVAKATGDWLIYINSDDLFYPGALQAMADAAVLHPQSQWIAGWTQVFDAEQTYNIKKPDQEGIERPGNWLTYEVHVPQHSSFVHRRLYEELGSYDDRLQFVFDLEFGLRLGHAGYRPVEIPKIMAGFRIHGESKTYRSQLPFLKEQRRLADQYRGSMGELEYLQTVKRLDRMIADAYIYSMGKEGASDAQTLVRSALSNDPSVVMRRPFWGALKKRIWE